MIKDNTYIPNSLALDILEDSVLYSEELNINLPSRKDPEIFKWFLASILFGTRISESIARKTYEVFEKYDLLDPNKIINAGRVFLINPIMKDGGFARYDEKTADQIIRNCQTLLNKFNGSLNQLHESSSNSYDLQRRVEEFYGIGPITSNIFLRELRPYWHNSNPTPLPMVYELAKKHNINLLDYNWKSLRFTRLESGLIRLRKELRTKPTYE